MSGTQIGVGVSGVAVVCCPHDVRKRQVLVVEYDKRRTKAHLCACCENLFLERTDTPMYCQQCRRPALHPLGGPLAPPKGVVD